MLVKCFFFTYCAKGSKSMSEQMTHGDNVLITTIKEGSIWMTNTYDDNSIHSKTFRLPKYLQKPVLWVHVHKHTRFVQRIVTAIQMWARNFLRSLISALLFPVQHEPNAHKHQLIKILSQCEKPQKRFFKSAFSLVKDVFKLSVHNLYVGGIGYYMITNKYSDVQ